MNKNHNFCVIIYNTVKEGVTMMDDDELIEDLNNFLENNGEIKLSNEEQTISIHSVDDNESYSYVSNNNKRFESSSEAIEWAILQFDGTENIIEWE